jgi:hypothetical protein
VNETAGTYAFVSHLKKHGAKVAGTAVTITQDDKRWVEINFGEDVVLDPETLEGIVNQFRALLESGTASIRTDKLQFESGAGLLNYANEVKSSLTPSEVIQ